MIWLLYALLALCFLTVALFLPRVFIGGEITPDRRLLSFTNIWFGLTYDSRKEHLNYRFLFFNFHSRIRDKNISKARSRPDAKPDGSRTTHQDGKIRMERLSKSGKSELSFSELWTNQYLVKKIACKCFRIIRRLYRAVRLEYLRSQITVASEDPMLTAIVYGALSSLLILNNHPRITLNLKADFEATSPVADVSVAWSFSPLVTFLIILHGMATLPWLRMYRFYRLQRWKHCSEPEQQVG